MWQCGWIVEIELFSSKINETLQTQFGSPGGTLFKKIKHRPERIEKIYLIIKQAQNPNNFLGFEPKNV